MQSQCSIQKGAKWVRQPQPFSARGVFLEYNTSGLLSCESFLDSLDVGRFSLRGYPSIFGNNIARREDTTASVFHCGIISILYFSTTSVFHCGITSILYFSILESIVSRLILSVNIYCFKNSTHVVFCWI